MSLSPLGVSWFKDLHTIYIQMPICTDCGRSITNKRGMFFHKI